VLFEAGDVAMEFSSVSVCGNDGEDPEKAAKAMRSMFGPQAVDNAIRQAITVCWMTLPDDKKNVAAAEAELRRVFERAIASLREDAQAFGIGEGR
jgi:hypothetical protein